MKTPVRNIPITLDEELARWASIEAARSNTSVSRFLAGILKERMMQKDNYKAAKRRALARNLPQDRRSLSIA